MNISVVSYLNSAPLVYGILRSGLLTDWNVSLDIPAVGADKLKMGAADIALVPVGAFAGDPRVNWIGDSCIGVNGPVRTVCLFSQVPIQQVERIWLDPHSRTSVRLIKILSSEYWNISPEWREGYEGFENAVVRDRDGAVCIGDKVFAVEGQYDYTYDLAEAWVKLTGLPFVFAGWASLKNVDPGEVDLLNRATRFGIDHLEDYLPELSRQYGLDPTVIRDYLTRNISYGFSPEKKLGMQKFFEYLKKEGD